MLRKLIFGVLLLMLLALIALIAAAVLIDPDDYRAQIAQQASDTLGREVRLEGPMSLSLFPWLALEIEGVRVGNPAALSDAPPLAQIGRAIASVRVMPLLSGELQTGALNLSDAQLTVVTGTGGVSNLDGLLEASDPSPNTPPLDLSGVNLGSVTLERVELVQLDLVTGDRTILSLDRMELASFAPERPLDFSLQARISDGEDELLVVDDLSGSMTVARDLGDIRLSDVALAYRLPGSEIRGRALAEAHVQHGAESRIVLDDVQTTLTMDDQSLGLNLTQPLTLTLGDAIDLQLAEAELRFNDQSLQTSGRVRLVDALQADLQVTGETLDLRPLTATTADTGSAETTTGPTDFSAIEAIDLALRLDLDRLLISDELTLDDVVTEARLRNGRLELAPMAARLFGGQFNGRVDVDFKQSPPAVALQPALSGIAMGQLAALSGAAAPLSGLGNAQLSLDFSGLDLPSILASLNGVGRIEIADGALEGVDLRRLIDEELTVSNLSNVSRAFGGRTAFDSLQAEVEVVDGVLSLPDLNLAASDFGVQGQGRIDFAADQIDYRLQLNLGPELTERLPGRLRDATRGRIPLAIAGPVAQPRVTIDFNSLLQSALRQELTERLFSPRDRGRDDTVEEASAESGATATDEGARDESSEDASEEERTSQLLLRGLLGRALEDSDDDSGETSPESDESEPPPN